MGAGDPRQFRLQSPEPPDAGADLIEMRARQFMRPRAGRAAIFADRNQIADHRDGQAEIARLPNEGQPLPPGAVIAALTAFRALNRRDQADFLIIADRRRLHAGAFCKLTDRKHGRAP